MRILTRDNKFRAIGFVSGFCSLWAFTALSSCNSADATTFIADVQATAVADAPIGCAFLPTFETVTDIKAKGNLTLTTVAAMADAICAAVKASGATPANPIALLAGPLPPAVTQPKVLGVEVHGRFVVKPS